MLYKNAYIFDKGNGFFQGAIRVEDGRFTELIHGSTNEPGQDMQGAYIIPGLIDIHTHGNSGADFSDGDYEGLVSMARYYAHHGITSFAPASMTLPYEVLAEAFACAQKFVSDAPSGCAVLRGINMEGPFFSMKKKGAQNGDYIKKPDYEALNKLQEGCGGLIKIVDVAPETEGAIDFIKKAKDIARVSIAHTDTDYDTAVQAFDAGATHLTHMFNAMPGIHHRNPGPICAAAERDDIVAELICDGLHIHESVIRTAFKLFPGRICIISDSLRCCGMPDGEYMLGGQSVYLKDNVARLSDGTIAGSATNLFDCLKNVIRFGIDMKEAINAATIVPAHELGCDDIVGSIEAGKIADFVLCDADLNMSEVYSAGLKIL